MKKFMCIMLVLGIAAVVNADLVLDDFESYGSDAALQAVWVPNTSSDIQNETVENVLNGQSMLIENHAPGVYWTQTNLTLPDAVHNVHGVNLTYQGFTALSMTFAIPTKTASGWEYLDGSGGDVYMSMYDCWGQKVFSASYAGDVTPSGTGWPNGIVWSVDAATGIQSGMNLENVETISIGYNNGWYGAGGMFVDDVTFVGVPEPATMLILGLGGIFMVRKRK